MQPNTQRPAYTDAAILDAAALKLAQEIAGRDREQDAKDIAAALGRQAPDFDAYRLTRCLEDDFGWEVDEGTVSAMEGAFMMVHQHKREAVEAWVRSNGIKPRRAIGDRVRVTIKGKDWRDVEHDGEIVAVNANEATYIVMVEALGHVRDGLGTRGIYVEFERIHELVAPPDEFELAG